MNALGLKSNLQESQRNERLQRLGLVKDRISIMTRTFNRPVELERSLASIIMQTQKNLELILVNDGDKLVEGFSVDVRYRDDITWRVIETNGLGRSCAANAAINAASGEWGLFLDDDDTIEPEHLEKLFYALRQSSPGCVASYSGTRWIRSDRDSECQDQEIKLFELLIGNKLPIHSVLFDLSVVREKQIYFDENISVYEDWDFWLQLGVVGEFKHVEGCSAVYNIGNGSGVHVLTPLESWEKVNLIREKWLDKIPIHWLAQFLDAYIEKESLNIKLSIDVAEELNKNRKLEEKIAGHEVKMQEMEMVRAELQRTLSQVHEYRSLLGSLRQELEKVYLSKSWRYTSLLRGMFRILRDNLSIYRTWFVLRFQQARKLFYFSWRFFKNVLSFGFNRAVSEAKKESLWLSVSSRIRAVKEGADFPLISVNPFDLVVRYSTEADVDYRCDRIAICASSRGNFFMREIGDLIGSALFELGYVVEYFDERAIEKASGSDLVIIIAPHEFFLLCQDKSYLENFLFKHNNLVLVNTEQPQTQWFASALNYLKKARVVWDMSFNVAVLLRSNGINAYHLPLGFCQTYQNKLLASQELDRTPPLLSLSEQITSQVPLIYKDRPIDILFVGTISPKRSAFFSKYAKIFSQYNCFFYLPNGDQPFIDTSNQTIDFNQLVGLAMRSKIVLNIHRDVETYFEWQRIVNVGVFSRALVISETCESNPFIIPNLHYLDVPLDLIPDFCVEFLRDEVKADQFAQRAFDRLSNDLILKDKLVRILGVIK